MEGENGYKKGLWTVEEDIILMEYIREHGKGRWNRIAKTTGLKRCGKSCRLRWINYLSPSVKRGDFSEEEDDLIIRLHNLLGNRWSLIAGRVPGRTDNQVKNHWNTHLSKKLGIKKGRSKLGASSQALPTIKVGESLKIPSESTSKAPFDSTSEPMDQKGIEDLSQCTVKLPSMQETTMSTEGNDSLLPSTQETMMSTEGNDSSFWFSTVDFPYPPSLMELLDECSLDFGWHGL
ncbi:hypothetical protein L1049_027865 [Liquidambar formosana]|uniref:Uncharacterized protein n=1 Tax=Liquidambar formosana TaxID=63359 RepID=A0AAP0RJX1_LIQFO